MSRLRKYRKKSNILAHVLTGLITLIITLILSGKISLVRDAHTARRADNIRISNNTARSVQNTFRSIAKKVRPSVVTIQTFASSLELVRPDLPEFYRNLFGYKVRQNSPVSIGSGFIIDHRGYIVTNYHVIKKSTTILVRLFDERTFQATIIGFDSGTDLAVLKIDGVNLPEVSLGDSAKIQVGDWAVAIGNPSGFTGTFTVGVISGTNRSEDPTGIYQNYIQTDTTINPGNSGGPLIDLDGRVIGVNSWIHSQNGQSSGINFAIPINTVMSYLTEIIKHGSIERGGYIGVTVRDASQQNSTLYGGYIVSVTEGGPAHKAGIKKDDILIAMNETPIDDVYKYMSLVINSRIGERAVFTVLREGKKVKIPVLIGREPIDISFLNISVEEVNPQHRKELGLLANDEGVIIKEIKPGSPMEKSGFKKGDLLFMIDNMLVKDVFRYKILSIVLKSRAWVFIKAKRKDKIHWAYVLIGTDPNTSPDVEIPPQEQQGRQEQRGY